MKTRGRPRDILILELTSRDADIMMRAIAIAAKLSFIAPSFTKQIVYTQTKIERLLNEHRETNQET